MHLIPGFVLALAACSFPSEEESAIRSVADPAMEAQQFDEVAALTEVASAEPQSTQPVAPSIQPSIEKVPEEPRLDESGERIFIPGLGWMPTTEFMDMYENHPEALPDGLDLVAIHEIREQLSGRG